MKIKRGNSYSSVSCCAGVSLGGVSEPLETCDQQLNSSCLPCGISQRCAVLAVPLSHVLMDAMLSFYPLAAAPGSLLKAS